MGISADTIVQKSGVNGMRLNVPAIVRTDSQNPIKIGDTVKVSIDGKKLTVTPVPAAKQETGVPIYNSENSELLC
jgi:hypothetical protein